MDSSPFCFFGGSGTIYIQIPFTAANRSDNRIPGAISGGVSFTGQAYIFSYENEANVYFRSFATDGSSTAIETSGLVTNVGTQCCITIAV